MELRIRTDSAQAAYTQVADIMQVIKTEIRQNLTMKYQAEATALDKLSKQSAKQAFDLNISIGSRVGERQVAVDLALSELLRKEINLGLVERADRSLSQAECRYWSGTSFRRYHRNIL